MSFLTSDAVVGKAEEYDDKIYLLGRDEKTFLSSIKNETIDREYFNWIEDAYVAPAVNVFTEGATFTDGTPSTPVLRTNSTQIIADTVAVSRTTDIVKKYGRDRESERLVLKRMVELSISQEYSCVGSKQAATTGLNRQFAGFQAMVDPANIVKTGATGTPVSEANTLAAMQALANVGKQGKIVSVTAADSITFANFAYAAGRTRMFDDTKLINTINFYVGPFGTYTVVQNFRQAVGDTLFYNPETWRNCVLDPWKRQTLAQVAHGTRVAIWGEYSLKNYNFKAAAIVRASA